MDDKVFFVSDPRPYIVLYVVSANDTDETLKYFKRLKTLDCCLNRNLTDVGLSYLKSLKYLSSETTYLQTLDYHM